MNCYNHPRIPAVGQCVVCGRGVCGDCQVVIEGARFCKQDGQKRLRKNGRMGSAGGRGVALSVAAVIYGLDGTIGIVGGFLLISLGMLVPAASGSALLRDAMKPYMDLFANPLLSSTAEAMIAGLIILVIGAVDITAGFYLWRRSRAGAIAAVVVSLVTGGVVGGLFLSVSATGPLAFAWAAIALVKLIPIGLGWRHL